MHQPIRGGLGYDGLQRVLAVSFVLAQGVDLVDDNAGLPWCGREMRAMLVVQWFLGLKQLLPVPLLPAVSLFAVKAEIFEWARGCSIYFYY